MTHTKQLLRTNLQQNRSSISPSYRSTAAKTAAQIFAASDLFRTSQHIACYHTHLNEFDTAPLITAIWQAKKICYLPVVSKDGAHKLNFVSYQSQDVLQLNRYKILEPAVSDESFFPIGQLDLVILPLLAFDLQGNRLGTGGGFYDQTFAFLLNQTIKKPYLIGLGYQQQQIETIAPDPWDVPLDGILTEKGLTLFVD